MILLLGSLSIFLLLGMPVFVAIGLSSVLYIIYIDLPPLMAIQLMFNGIDNFVLLAVPFFILAGNLMNAAKITDRVFTFANNLVGHIRGGIGHVNIVASIIFSGMSGTATADAGGLGTVELKAMKDGGYDLPFSVGVTAGSSTLGPIIPPSLPMIVYGAIASVSVGKLFVAGIIPGLIVSVCLFALVYYYAIKRSYPRSPRANLRDLFISFQKSLPALLTPMIILFGIIFGVFTPTEAAVVAVIYATVVASLVYKSMTLKQFISVVRDTFETTAVVMIMVAASMLFGWILIREQTAAQATQALLALTSETWQVLFILNLMLLVIGMFMETVAIILILTPIITPVLTTFGIDLVQFGVIMVLNLMIGLMTPPIGLLLFVMARLAKMDMTATVKACAPFQIPLWITLILINLFPAITLFLPKVVFG